MVSHLSLQMVLLVGLRENDDDNNNNNDADCKYGMATDRHLFINV